MLLNYVFVFICMISFSDVWDYSTLHDRRSLSRSQYYDEWVSVSPLIPMSTYTVQVNASNTVGFILSNIMPADMPPGCKLLNQSFIL